MLPDFNKIIGIYSGVFLKREISKRGLKNRDLGPVCLNDKHWELIKLDIEESIESYIR